MDDLIRENTQNIKVEKVTKLQAFTSHVIRAPSPTPILIETNDPEDEKSEESNKVQIEEEVPTPPTKAEIYLKMMQLHPALYGVRFSRNGIDQQPILPYSLHRKILTLEERKFQVQKTDIR